MKKIGETAKKRLFSAFCFSIWRHPKVLKSGKKNGQITFVTNKDLGTIFATRWTKATNRLTNEWQRMN